MAATIYSSAGDHEYEVSRQRAIVEHQANGDERNVAFCAARISETEQRLRDLEQGRVEDRGPGGKVEPETGAAAP